MKRFTTPTHKFKVNVDLTEADVVILTYAQCGRNLFSKQKEDLTIESNLISYTLSQKETGMFDPNMSVSIEITAKLADGKRITSNIMTTKIEQVLYTREI